MTPEELFPGYEFNGLEISIPISSLDNLLSPDVHPTQGDWRKLFFSICSTAQTYYNNLDSTEKSSAFYASNPLQYKSNLYEDAVKKVYIFKFTGNMLLSDPIVTDEPL